MQEPSFIERRKKSLAQYVNSLNAHQRELRCNDALCVFLELTSVCRAAQVGDLARTDRLLSLGRESTEQDEKVAYLAYSPSLFSLHLYAQSAQHPHTFSISHTVFPPILMVSPTHPFLSHLSCTFLSSALPLRRVTRPFTSPLSWVTCL